MLAAAADETEGLEWATMIGGGTLVVVAVVMMLRTRRIVAGWEHRPAVVTANVTRSMGGGNHDVFPRFTFVTAQGHEMSIEQGSNRPRFDVGAHVHVFHDPHDPSRVRVDHWVALYLAPVLLSLAGSAVLALTPFLI